MSINARSIVHDTNVNNWDRGIPVEVENMLNMTRKCHNHIHKSLMNDT